MSMTIKELIEELSEYKQNSQIKFATSPWQTHKVLSIYLVEENGEVWIDLGDDGVDVIT